MPRFLLSIFFTLLLWGPLPKSSAAQTPDVQSSQARTEQNDLEREFALAVSRIEKGEFGPASESLERLQTAGAFAGYENLTGFSFQLFRLAAKRYSAEKITSDESNAIKFLVNHALKLSPTSPRVALGASSFSQVIGWSEALRMCFLTVANLGNSPTMAGAMLVDTTLLSLVVLTVALLVVLPVKFCQHSALLMAVLSKLLAPQWTGIGSAVLFLVCGVAPLLFGLLFAVCVWGVLIAGAVLRSPKLTLLVGAVVLSWGLLLPIIGTMSENLRAPLELAIEDEIFGNYSRESNQLFRSLDGDKLGVPELLLARGTFRGRTADFEGARKDLEQVLVQSSSKSPVGVSASNNIAAIWIKQKNFAGAKEFLQKEAETKSLTFESKYNLLQANISLTELQEQERLYKELNSTDKSRLHRAQDAKADALFLKLPLRFFFSRYLRSNAAEAFSSTRVASAKTLLTPSESKSTVTLQLWKTLGFPGGQAGMILCGAAVVLHGFMLKRRRYVRAKSEYGTSLFWAFFPGGSWFSGQCILRGIFVLAFVLATVCVFLDAPIHFSALRSAQGFIRYVSLVAGILIYLVALGTKLVLDNMRRSDG